MTASPLQVALVAADTIVFQFPFYWYSVPPLLKEWIDLVLEHGFAYGLEGDLARRDPQQQGREDPLQPDAPQDHAQVDRLAVARHHVSDSVLPRSQLFLLR